LVFDGGKSSAGNDNRSSRIQSSQMVSTKGKSFQKFGITFDEKGETVISIKEMTNLLAQVRSGKLFCEEAQLSDQNYLLIENHSSDYYIFPNDKLEAWGKDGSFEKGDALYKIELVKRF
jgi:hypothetical protein